MRALLIVALAASSSACTTARGLADDGRLKDACYAVEENPSPLLDDDRAALATRIRKKIPGNVSVRALDPKSLVSEPELLVSSPPFLEIVIEAPGFSAIDEVTLIDAVGTRVPVRVVDEEDVLAMFGAPRPPAAIARSSTHTPGPLEQMMKAIGIVTVGIPITIATLGMVPPDLGGLFSSGPSTSSWLEESPDMPAWRARREVIAAVQLGSALGIGSPSCGGGQCRVVLPVRNADAFVRASFRATLDLDGCTLPDTLEVPLRSTTPLADAPGDDKQWERFRATGCGLIPFLSDVGDCCAAPFELLDECRW